MTEAIHPAPVEFSQQLIDVDPILRYFHYAHLPMALQASSRPFCELAAHIVTTPLDGRRRNRARGAVQWLR